MPARAWHAAILHVRREGMSVHMMIVGLQSCDKRLYTAVAKCSMEHSRHAPNVRYQRKTAECVGVCSKQRTRCGTPRNVELSIQQ
jgi:hypothetical protein